jgi:hypothetical protein
VFDPGDRLVIDRDVLNCGPTPRCETLEAWRVARGAFWSGMPSYSALEFDAAGRELLDERERLREAERITLWAATGPSDQFFVAHVLHRAEEWGIDAAKIYLVQFERFHDRAQRVLATGELNERRMSEYPEPAPISAASLRDYRSAWSAITSPDPTDIERFGERHPDANGWLRQAMQLLLRGFPDKKSGMSWWDFALLREVRAHGPIAARVIGFTMGHDLEDPDRVGDLYLFGRLLSLGAPRLPAPLLEISGDRTKMREVQVTLTPIGLDVLEGKRSSYPANPIEDWVAGVKLSSAEGALWFNDAGTLVRGR